MIDGNTASLNKHLDEQEEGEKKRERLFKYLENEFEEYRILVAKIQLVAKDFEGIDFTDDINEALLGEI